MSVTNNPETPGAQARPQGRSISTMTIILFLLLAAAIGALVVDQQARRSAQSTFNDLNQAIGDGKTVSEISQADVHKKVGREPDDDDNPNDLYEQYSWQGAPYKHTIYIAYWPGKTLLLKDVSLNKPLH